MTTYSIKDLEKLSGIKAHTIRIWEKRYSLIQPERTATNIRVYNSEELKHLINVSTLVKHGHKISKLSKLDKNEVSKLIESYSISDDSHTALISQMIDTMIQLDEHQFKALFEQSIDAVGFEATIIDVIFPLLRRIGTMWTVGTILPGHEHFLSNLIRQKIIGHTEKITQKVNPKLPSFVLFLPEGEWHEIGLLFMNFMLKKRGFKVDYLGGSVIETDLLEIFKVHQIDYLFTIITTTYSRKNILEYLNKISKIVGKRTIFITGAAIANLKNLPANITFISNYNEALEVFNQLHHNSLSS